MSRTRYERERNKVQAEAPWQVSSLKKRRRKKEITRILGRSMRMTLGPWSTVYSANARQQQQRVVCNRILPSWRLGATRPLVCPFPVAPLSSILSLYLVEASTMLCRSPPSPPTTPPPPRTRPHTRQQPSPPPGRYEISKIPRSSRDSINVTHSPSYRNHGR